LFDPKIIRPLGTCTSCKDRFLNECLINMMFSLIPLVVDKTELKEWGVHTCLELKEYDTDILSLLQETELLDPKDVSSFTKVTQILFLV
jgi:hypothetical protein